MKILNKIISTKKDIEDIFDKAVSGEKLLITYFNKHCFNVYYENSDYRKVLEKFTVYTDGIGIYLGLRFLGKNPDKHNATDLNHILFSKFIKEKIPVFILGGNFNEKELMRASKEKGLIVAGYKNGFFNYYHDEILNEIIQKNPVVIVIGMGVPKQEFIAEKIYSKYQCSIICVGSFMEFYFGTIKRAPIIMRKFGMEWLFRIYTEPRRLIRRYFYGIPLFLLRIFKLKTGYNS